MLSIKPNSSQKAVTANLLPCRIHHDGQIPISERHWSACKASEQQDPTKSENDLKTTYFRGRKLFGSEITLPEGYVGAVIKTTEEVVAVPTKFLEDEEEMEEEPVTLVAKQEGSFERIVVWRHDEKPNETEDQYIRGIQEWMGFAKAVSMQFLLIDWVRKWD
jgi:ribonuclease H2 subunit C